MALARLVMPRSVVARTTLAIIALAMLVGLLFAVLASVLVHRNEQERLHTRLDELVSTVESTLRIACYVQDAALAKEIATGLLSNEVVDGVRILADGVVLYEQVPRRTDPASSEHVTSHVIRSPFDDDQQVGTVELHASKHRIGEEAWVYTRFILLVLALEVALIAVSVAMIVYNLITRPIIRIAQDLHQLEIRPGAELQMPKGHEQDEIGQVIRDGNRLISKLTSLIEAERTLRLQREHSERRLSLIFEKADTGLFEIDAEGRLHACNPAFSRILGTPPDSKLLLDLLQAHRETVDGLIQAALSAGETRDVDLEIAASGGEEGRWVALSLTPLEDARLQGVVIDITERKQAELAARQLAQRDTLTGLFNRRGFDQGLANALQRMQRERDLGIALLLVDLDLFKQVNDTYGHEAGDLVLRRVAEILEHAVRRSDVVARYGGDEFAIVLIGIQGIEKAESIARQIIDDACVPVDVGNGQLARIGASVGIAMALSGEESASSLIRRADEALYAAKQAGRNTYRLAKLPLS